MAERPKSTVVALRELAANSGKSISEYPLWFKELWDKDPSASFSIVLSSAADELELMQKLNGKLYKTLYPD